jgi:hypothetical protein
MTLQALPGENDQKDFVNFFSREETLRYHLGEVGTPKKS